MGADRVSGQSSLNSTMFDVLKSELETPVDLGSADAGWICRCEDKAEYVIKDGISKDSTPIVPHCEWFCTALADALQIAAPTPKIIQRLDGSLVFGSRIIGGIVNPDENGAGYWWELVKDGTIDLEHVKPVLSHIYAFDHFVHNVDRHYRNFLAEKQKNSYAVYSIDYSRAWLRWGFPSPSIPFNPSNNTIECQRWLANFWGTPYIVQSEVEALLRKVKGISRERILRMIEDHPAEWLEDFNKIAILDWWGSPDFLSRITAIEAGVKNATCL